MTLLYTFRHDHAGQCFLVELEDVVDAVIHVHRNLLPMQEAEVALFQKGLVFGILHSLDGSDDFTLQFHQCIDVPVNLSLQVDILQTVSAIVEVEPLGFRGMPVMVLVHLVARSFREATCSILLSMRWSRR